VSAIETLFDRVVGAADNQKDEGGGAKSWWRWPLIILLVLVAIAAFAWFSQRDAKELARLRHAKKKADVERAQAQTDAAIAKETAVIEEHQKKIDEALTRIEEIDTEVKEVEARLAKRKNDIDRIRTWDDAGSDDAGQG
jgi:peptidoglycan hydrolase CwlO-like protein